ncbi:hypothetical protein KP509_01G120700 [Ceratopteris richardii]|uniref:Uncharacterized protein n=1 Tax=Ceratopteris richardii TaxID=49495 RepID=A0A8T2VQL1_CERRI|nr:hypothetical protein KP509_01G120700 [Ceratopteris richardii]
MAARVFRASQSLEELSKGFYGCWKDGKWVRPAISARYRNRLRKETLLSGEEWPYDKPRKEMKPKMKGHKCDRLAAEKRARTEELMKKMPQMLFDYKMKINRKAWRRMMKLLFLHQKERGKDRDQEEEGNSITI